MKIAETKCGIRHKLYELKTKDVTFSGFLKALRKAINEHYFKELYADYTEYQYEKDIKEGWVTVCDDGFVVWYEGDKEGCICKH